MVFHERESCRGDLWLTIRRHGRFVAAYGDHNLVVNTGRVRLAELVTGKSSACITQVGIGTGAANEDERDTQLSGQKLFPIAKADIDDRDARFAFVIDEGQANGMSIREFGLFTSDGVMFSHRVRRNREGKSVAIEKADDIAIEGVWIIHF